MKGSKKKTRVEDPLVEQLRSQLARLLADYDNLRKRTESEKESWLKFAGVNAVRKFLPVLDNLENVQKHLGDQGLAITILEFKKILNEDGFSEIIPLPGDDFDTNKMEVVEAVEGGVAGKIVESILSGWQSNDIVVRHARVKVYKGEVVEN